MPAFVLVSFYPGIDIGVQKRLLIYLFTATFCELEYYSKLVVFTFSHNLHSGDQKEARNSSRKFRQGGMRLGLIAPPGSPGSCFDAFLCGARTPGLRKGSGNEDAIGSRLILVSIFKDKYSLAMFVTSHEHVGL